MNDMNSPATVKNTGGAVHAMYPLAPGSLAQLGFHEPALARLRTVIERHIAEGRYPGSLLAAIDAALAVDPVRRPRSSE